MKRLLPVLLALLPIQLGAQRTLTLDECRQMAVNADKTLEQQRTKLEMAGYDRKIAAANYFPKVSAYGTWQHIGGDFALIESGSLPQFGTMGTTVQNAYKAKLTEIYTEIALNPATAAELASSPLWQKIFSDLGGVDLETALNRIGTEIDGTLEDKTNPDLSNLYIGAVSLEQPLFMGGKIVAANKMARYAEELARLEYEGERDEALVAVDQAYWQVVSVANKLKLAQSYSQLLRNMLSNVEVSVKEGVATESDALTVRVKSNEADMALTKAANGLVLARMLLCKRIGLPLDSDISLADEALEAVPLPLDEPEKSIEEVLASRSETRRLDLAAKIYDQKVNMARADMLPKIALMANYAVMNPNMNNGFQTNWGTNWTAGVVVSVPIFHGTEALQKTRKARAEATIYRSKYQDAGELINMQVTQLRQQQKEALERLEMSGANLDSAEENLRMATVGFEAGVIDANTALAAQTAWLKAHSEYIDAGIEVQMNSSKLKQALGNYTEGE